MGIKARLGAIEAERKAVIQMVGVMLAHSRRLAVSKDEAAAMLGVSPDFFDQHISPEIRHVRRGRRRLFPVAELVGWLWRAAEDHDEDVFAEIDRMTTSSPE